MEKLVISRRVVAENCDFASTKAPLKRFLAKDTLVKWPFPPGFTRNLWKETGIQNLRGKSKKMMDLRLEELFEV